MSIEKCRSVVLSAMPYRETSLLLNLFSREQGRLHGIAKGVRRADKRGGPIERGYVIDHLAYIGRGRDLHLVTECHLQDHFPSIRGNIEKTAARDVLLDLLLSAIKDSDPHRELYEYLELFLRKVDGFSAEGTAPLLLYLSKSIFGVAAHLGFGIDLSGCTLCKKNIGDASRGAMLALTQGTVRCADCADRQSGGDDRLLPQAAVRFFSAAKECPPPQLTLAEALRLLHTAADYCRYHADVRKPLGSIGFIDELFGAGSTAFICGG